MLNYSFKILNVHKSPALENFAESMWESEQGFPESKGTIGEIWPVIITVITVGVKMALCTEVSMLTS